MSSLTLGIRLVGVQTPEYLLCVGFLTKIDYSIDSITKIIMRKCSSSANPDLDWSCGLGAVRSWHMVHGPTSKKKQIWPIVECRTWTNAKDSTMAAPLQSQIGTTTHFICLTRNCLAEEQWFQLMYSRSIPLFKRTPRAYPASCVKPSFLAHAQLGLRTSFEPFHATKQCESCVQRLGQNFEALPWVLVWILTWHVFIRGTFLQK